MQRFGGYFVMGVSTDVGWPSKDLQVRFRGHTITLRPETTERAPSLVVRIGSEFDLLAARRLLQEFMSVLAWVRGGALVETTSACTSGAPLFIGKGIGRFIDDAPIEHLPEPTDPRGKLGLALYREASSANLLPYQFLGYFKIINILYGPGPDQVAWINRTVGKLNDKQAVERRDQLVAQNLDVGAYLYKSGRCAVAHAFDQNSVVNPDEPEDIQLLSADLPLIKTLAEYAVENELGVKSYRTILREHLYELEGFRALFGDATVGDLKARKSVAIERLSIPTRLSLRLQDQPPFSSFERLCASVKAAHQGIVQLHLQRDDGLFEANVLLSFPDERLVFDALRHAVVRDDGTATAARVMLDFVKFERAWIANGVNELWDAEKGQRLGQSAPVVLVNCRPDWRAIDKNVAALEAEIERRTRNTQQDGSAGEQSDKV